MTLDKRNTNKIDFNLAYDEVWVNSLMEDCTLCPRKCHVNRLAGQTGFCGQGANLYAARAALHFWEEPCISGTNGSGTVFFSGCNLRCIFCQNYDIAHSKSGREITLERLAEIFLELQDKGAHNINLVTPSHFIPQICIALQTAKKNGLTIPIVYNTGNYESVESLKYLDGLIDIYLPDFKYFSPELSKELSLTDDYFKQAATSLAEMYRQVGKAQFDSETGLMKKGIIVRHLLLPGQSKDSKKILRYLYETYKNDIYVSIMNQYTPMPQLSAYEANSKVNAFSPSTQATEGSALSFLTRKVTDEEYKRVLKFAQTLGIENGFLQEGETADESFIPPFNYEGL